MGSHRGQGQVSGAPTEDRRQVPVTLGSPEAVPSGTWALVGKPRQGDIGSQGPPGLSRSPTPAPTPAAVGLSAPGLLVLLPSPHAPSPHPTPGLLFDSPQHSLRSQLGALACYSGSQESTLPGAHFVCGYLSPSPAPRFLHSSCQGLTLEYLRVPTQECWVPLRCSVGRSPPGQWSVCGRKGEPGRGKGCVWVLST